MDRRCWVLTCSNPATMRVHISSVRFAGERYRLVPVCDVHGRHVEGRGLPLEEPATVIAEAPTPDVTPAPDMAPRPKRALARPGTRRY